MFEVDILKGVVSKRQDEQEIFPSASNINQEGDLQASTTAQRFLTRQQEVNDFAGIGPSNKWFLPC